MCFLSAVLTHQDPSPGPDFLEPHPAGVVDDAEDHADEATRLLPERISPWRRWRRLTYNAFTRHDHSPSSARRQPQPKNKGAYNVSATKRAAQVAFAILICCVASGPVFGYAALKPVLIAEGVYHDLCPADEPTGVSHGIADDNSEVPCVEQDIRLNILYIAASITLNVSTVFAGYTLDRWGRRICYLISAVILAAGTLLMASAFAIPKFDGYLAGNVLLGLGGTYVFVPSFQLANAFPKYSGLIVALVTGAFDASAAVFLFYRMAYEASGGRFKPSQFFFGFVAVPMLILLGELTLMSPQGYHTTAELEHKIKEAQDHTRDAHHSDTERRLAKLDRIERVAGDADQREERAKRTEERLAASGVWGVLHGLPPYKQMLTPWFILLLLLTVLQMLRMNYFIATIRAQYRYMLGSEEQAELVNHIFDVALPVAGVASTPFIGWLLNSLSIVTILSVLTFFIIAVGVLNCLPYVWAGYLTVFAFVLFRPLYYSAMSDYATKVFGFATFGRIYGALICISGLVNIVQPGLDALTHGPLNGNPAPVNIFMAVAGTALSVSLTVFVALHSEDRSESIEGRRLLDETESGLVERDLIEDEQ
ncbi:Protein FMP42-like protein 2 [Pleurostoma richardsiae]|uniref:Protein FMP42-like protein 2 n=1 Tax=Pleurostoma richardsiae TaxID=41990 RepID=A0AA38VG69_9PEZI|nr:Protein FMP42-like protein 2 [Pleurostoma richardsiae]